MIQIGVQPLSAPPMEGPLADPRITFGDELGRESRSASGQLAESIDSSLFVSPPPLPFPRVFPGL
jgi:hypothetical protein